MELVIELTEYDIEWIKNAGDIPDELKRTIADAIICGQSLGPHEDLIERQKLFRSLLTTHDGRIVPDHDIDNWPVQIDVKRVKQAILKADTVIPGNLF